MTKTLLWDAIASIESGNNHRAMRFDPDFCKHDPQWVEGMQYKIMQIHGCNQTTAWMIAATSFGSFQLLGANIYSLGWEATIFDFIYSAPGQFHSFSMWIEKAGFSATENIDEWNEKRFLKFALYANGTDDPETYIARMKRRILVG